MLIPSLIQTFANRIFHSTVQYVYVQIHGQNMYFPPQKQSPMRARESTSRGSWSTFGTQETSGTGTKETVQGFTVHTYCTVYSELSQKRTNRDYISQRKRKPMEYD